MSNYKRKQFLKSQKYFLENQNIRKGRWMQKRKHELKKKWRLDRVRRKVYGKRELDPLKDYDYYPRITNQLKRFNGENSNKEKPYYYLLHSLKEPSKFLCSDAYNDKSKTFLLVFFRAKTLREYYQTYCKGMRLQPLKIREDKLWLFLRAWLNEEKRRLLDIFDGIGIVGNGSIPIIDYKWIMRRVIEVKRSEEEIVYGEEDVEEKELANQY